MTSTLLETGCSNKTETLPDGFVYLSEVDSTMIQDARYFGSENFLGRPVNGYESGKLVMTESAAHALKTAHDIVKAKGYRFVIYDTYRPQRAVDDFKSWSDDLSDTKTKSIYYPLLEKNEIHGAGYISMRSWHSRGSTVDLTIIKEDHEYKLIGPKKRTLTDGQEIYSVEDGTVDMGGSFDLFHEISHHDTPLGTPLQLANRDSLRQAMTDAGFTGYSKEWWHYSFDNEPFPNTYFDFVVR